MSPAKWRPRSSPEPMIRIFGTFLVTAPLWAQTSTGPEFFEQRIRPIFATKCQGCHGPQKAMAGLNLSTAATFEKGSDRGPIVKKGVAAHSRLIEVTSYESAV